MNRALKVTIIALYDIFTVVTAWLLAILVMQENTTFSIAECLAGYNYLWLVGGIAIALVSNAIFGIYEQCLSFASVHEGVKILLSCSVEAVYMSVVSAVQIELGIPWVVVAVGMYFALAISARFSYRFVRTFKFPKKKEIKKVAIVGMCRAASLLIKEMQEGKTPLRPVCIIDDNKKNLGQTLQGVQVVATTDEIESVCQKYEIKEVIISQPVISKKQTSDIIRRCQKTGIKVKILPDLSEIADGTVTVSSIKSVNVTDLLGRDQVSVNLDEIMGYISGKVVMVTGGGGSIGSELCRQIAKNSPKQLIIVDIYENNAYEIEQELKRHYPELNLKVLIASVRDQLKVNTLFKELRPEIVFHAAAHKHVPFMEDSPNEAVKNNVHGTLNVATAAGKYGAKKFVLISTDKAVNPTNIMGATKRICEMIVQTLDKHYDTDFVAVRFGNVLGSNGSVIPLFARQIREGGPVTVTHKEIVRYFMTIPEAVSLVLQAGANAKGGEIFVLDMGEPMNIYELALNMIRLSGLEPFTDIDVVVTGLRPGEKLYEERLMDEEGLQKTANKLISIAKPIEVDEEQLFDTVHQIYKKARKETDDMKYLVHELVPTYTVYEGKK